MNLFIAFGLVLFGLSFTLPTSDASKGCYRAAAYEHVVVGHNRAIDPSDPLEYVRENLKAFAMAARAARDEGAKIIVFPEGGLFGFAIFGSDFTTFRRATKLLMEDIPDPRQSTEPIVPCGNSDFDHREILHTLSCVAKSNSIYLLADMGDIKQCAINDTKCPDDGVYMYNTQVAFDRKGALVGRYHKYHLYGEFQYNKPDHPELIYFDTDFGARVGMHICFDRLFHDPIISLVGQYNVTTMALSTWWFDEYPNLVSTQVDQGLSLGLGINIITSNAKQPRLGTTGSGIYSPSYVAISEHDTGKNSQFTRAKLIIGNLPVDPKSSVRCDPDPWSTGFSKYQTPTQKYRFKEGNFSMDRAVRLFDGQGNNVTVCQDNFCCSLDYEFVQQYEPGKEDMYLGVVNHERNYDASNYRTYEQICLVVAYDRAKATFPMTGGRKFKSLTIRGTFDTKYVYSSVLSDDFELVSTESLTLKSRKVEAETAEGEKHERQLDVRTRRPVLSVTLYGRLYERDRDFGQAEI